MGARSRCPDQPFDAGLFELRKPAHTLHHLVNEIRGLGLTDQAEGTLAVGQLADADALGNLGQDDIQGGGPIERLDLGADVLTLREVPRSLEDVYLKLVEEPTS